MREQVDICLLKSINTKWNANSLVQFVWISLCALVSGYVSLTVADASLRLAKMNSTHLLSYQINDVHLPLSCHIERLLRVRIVNNRVTSNFKLTALYHRNGKRQDGIMVSLLIWNATFCDFTHSKLSVSTTALGFAVRGVLDRQIVQCWKV